MASCDLAQAQNIELVGQIGGACQAVCVAGDYAYVGEGGSLTVLDVTTPTAPVLLCRLSLPDPGGTRGRAVVRDIEVSGGLAYVACSGAGLQIVDVSDPLSPTLLGSVGTTGTATGVAVSGGMAYVSVGWGSVYDAEGTLCVIDVTSPSMPAIRGSYQLGGWADDVYVLGTWAYVVNWANNTTGYPGGLKVFDVTDPAQPSYRGYYDMPGGVPSAVAVSGGLAHVAAGPLGLIILDVSSPAPVILGVYDTPMSAAAVAVSGNLAYVIGSGGNGGRLAIIDVSDPTFPRRRGECDAPGASIDVDATGGLAYVAGGNVKVIDVSDDLSPLPIGSYDTIGSPSRLAVSGSMAYVIDSGAFRVIDVSRPELPALVGSYQPAGGDVCVSGNHAYVTWLGSFLVLDVSDPALPQPRGSCGIGFTYGRGMVSEIALSGTVAYVAWDEIFVDLMGNVSYEGGLHTVDIGNPTQPQCSLLWSDHGGFAQGVAVSGSESYVAWSGEPDGFSSGLAVIGPDGRRVGWHHITSKVVAVDYDNGLAYVTARSRGILILDVADPSNVREVGSYSLADNSLPWEIFVADGLAYVAAKPGKLTVLGVTDPTSPVLLGSYETNDEYPDVFVSGGLIYIANASGGLLVLHYTGLFPPEAPPRIVALPASMDRIDVYWRGGLGNTDGFKLERKTGATGAWLQITTTTANATHYNDAGLAPNTPYYYRVRAYGAAGNSFYSEVAYARTPPGPTAAQPAWLRYR